LIPLSGSGWVVFGNRAGQESRNIPDFDYSVLANSEKSISCFVNIHAHNRMLSIMEGSQGMLPEKFIISFSFLLFIKTKNNQFSVK
jgi:hypothetical protein